MNYFIKALPQGLADTLEITEGYAAASQSCLAPAGAADAPGWLRGFGEGYFRFLRVLPLIGSARATDGGWYVGLAPAPRHLAFLRFAPPYVAAARGGRELRYPIVGGLMAHGPAGHIAFGAAPEGDHVRIWVDVVGYWPRLGGGWLYSLSQAQIHRAVTIAYLWAQSRRAMRCRLAC